MHVSREEHCLIRQREVGPVRDCDPKASARLGDMQPRCAQSGLLWLACLRFRMSVWWPSSCVHDMTIWSNSRSQNPATKHFELYRISQTDQLRRHWVSQTESEASLLAEVTQGSSTNLPEVMGGWCKYGFLRGYSTKILTRTVRCRRFPECFSQLSNGDQSDLWANTHKQAACKIIPQNSQQTGKQQTDWQTAQELVETATN